MRPGGHCLGQSLHLSAIARPAHNADVKMCGDEHHLVCHVRCVPHAIEDLLTPETDVSAQD